MKNGQCSNRDCDIMQCTLSTEREKSYFTSKLAGTGSLG